MTSELWRVTVTGPSRRVFYVAANGLDGALAQVHALELGRRGERVTDLELVGDFCSPEPDVEAQRRRWQSE